MVQPNVERTRAQTRTGISTVSASVGDNVGGLTRSYKGSWHRKIREMRKDPTIALARWMTVAPVLSTGWAVEAEDDAPEGSKEFIDGVFTPMRLHVMKHIMYGQVDYGWQPFEKVFEINRDGLYAIKKLKPLLQESTEILVFKDTGAYAGLVNNSFDGEEVILDVADTLLVSLDAEGTDWYGQAVALNAERPYDAWLRLQDGAERYEGRIAGTHWVIYYPLGKSPFEGQPEVDNYTIAEKILQALESSGRIIIPRAIANIIDELNLQMQATNIEALQWKIEQITDSGSGGVTFSERQKYMDVLKVRGFGLPERAVLEGTFGTKAEAGEHIDIALTNMDLRYQEACQTINWHCVNQLLRVNYGAEAENTVRIVPNPVNDTQKAFFRQLYLALIANPNGFDQELLEVDWDAVRDAVGMPTREEGGLLDLPRLTDSRDMLDDNGNDGNDGLADDDSLVV